MKPDEELDQVTRGSVDLYTLEDLRRKLSNSRKVGTPLRVKYGVDPTSADLHLGHVVPIRKLKQLQDLGYEIIFLIGDFTARIGDPSGRLVQRKPLGKTEVLNFAETYTSQVFKILDKEKVRLVYNSEWLEGMNLEDVCRLSSLYTVARMLERADFKQRYRIGKDISIVEFLYPLLQGYDSVHLQADIEIGGTDQIFNLLVGRELQRDYGQEPQVVLTLPLLEGIDGVQKMSKTAKNYIGIDEPPREIFGKLMSIPDGLMVKYFRLLTDLSDEEIDEIELGLRDESLHPKDVKRRLARNIVSQFYNQETAERCDKEFERVFRRRGLPDEICEIRAKKGSRSVVDLLIEARFANSRSEARRLITQGGVKVDHVRVKSFSDRISMDSGHILQVGRRKFARIIPEGE
jgi:tyrosyl-tRNA synthetase